MEGEFCMSLKLEHITKSYGCIEAVKDVSFTSQGKHFIVLAGPSGCGKTTLLQLIAGFLKPDSGSIWIDDKEVQHAKPHERDIAMVFQDAALFPSMTVYDNIAYGLTYGGLSKQEAGQRVRAMAEVLGIDGLLKRKAEALSNGQKQRVSIARALVRRPKLFLMDEAFSALDTRLKAQLRLELAKLYQQLDATFLYVTHDRLEAMTLADTLIVMKEGVFQQIGDPLKLYRDPANLFVAAFLGTYEINTLQAYVDGNILTFEKECIKLSNTYEAQEVIMAIRPEHLIFSKEGMRGRIVLVEHLGDECYIRLVWQDQLFYMKVDRKVNIQLYDEVCFRFEPKEILLFDKTSEQRLFGK